jgi:hypothetical protein
MARDIGIVKNYVVSLHPANGDMVLGELEVLSCLLNVQLPQGPDSRLVSHLITPPSAFDPKRNDLSNVAP